MDNTEQLREEHRIIERMLAVIEKAASNIDSGKEVDADFFPKVVDFIRNFADGLHHGKEETNLFPYMGRRGIPTDGGPIGVMLAEHEEGRACVMAVEEAARRFAAGDKSALKMAENSALRYAGLLRQHIEKEDNILYVMADQVLTPEDQKELLAVYDDVEKQHLDGHSREHYIALVEELEREVGLA